MKLVAIQYKLYCSKSWKSIRFSDNACILASLKFGVSCMPILTHLQIKTIINCSFSENGTLGGTRTPSLMLRTHLLYPLSYEG